MRKLALLLVSSCHFLTCSGATSQELLDANFLTRGSLPIELFTPTDTQAVTTPNPTMSWSPRGVSLYRLQIATDNAFSSLVVDKEVIGSSYTIQSADMNSGEVFATGAYFWRVSVPKVANSLQSETGSMFFVIMPASGSGYAGKLYVNQATGSTLPTGSRVRPFKSIQAAINTVEQIRSSNKNISFDLLVAKGTYSEAITMTAGISLRGGYAETAATAGSAPEWPRSISGNVTTIQAIRDYAVTADTSITAAYTNTTWLEGFTINGAANLITTNAILLATASPTISQNNISDGAPITTSGQSTGIKVTNGTPVISRNTISGGTGNTAATAISLTSSNATVAGNNIIGGSIFSASPIYSAISTNNSSPLIYNNVIMAGASNNNNYSIDAVGGSPKIFNNSINTSSLGAGTGVRLSGGSTPSIINNIIFVPFCSAAAIGIREVDVSSDPSLVQNNNLYGTCGRVYEDEAAATVVTFGTFGTQAIAQPTGLLPSMGNVNITNSTNQFLVDFDGPDNLDRTIADNNWRLIEPVTNTCNIHFGGRDLSAFFSDDSDGVVRTAALPTTGVCVGNVTNIGAAGWSMGAYERDQ